MTIDNTTWTARDGFSATQGDKQWYYEYPVGKTLAWVDGCWQISEAEPTPYIEAGLLHPGLVNALAQDAVLRWDAPHAGTLRITGTVAKAVPQGDGVRVRITRNHSKVWPEGGTMADAWVTLAADDTTGVEHDVTVAVNKGDQIRFVVNMTGDDVEGDATAWNPTITYTNDLPEEPVPEPLYPSSIETGDSITFYPVDSDEVLINPDKGWIAYEAEGNRCRNGDWPEYLAEVVVEGDTLDDMPISDIYTRISWACFENDGEGEYDWSWFDRVFERFEGTGKTFSFRVAAFGYWGPTSPEKYCTPQWVEEAGAQGEFLYDIEWRPNADDPVFLDKLARFMNALGERYGQRDDISYVDLGSLGRWGEGHNHPYDLETFKKHYAILENAFPNHQLVVNDDMGPECSNWALDEKDAWIRDDSPFRWDPNSFPCMRLSRLDRPNIFESRHIREWFKHVDSPNVPWQMVKEDLEQVFACLTSPVSYTAIHHYPRDFMNNMGKDWVDYWANKMGYWFILQQAKLPSPLQAGSENTLEIQVENRGIDSIHRDYRLALSLTLVGDTSPAYVGTATNADARKWLPDQTSTNAYTWVLPDLPAGEYIADVALVAPDGDDMTSLVKFGNHGRLENGWLRFGTVMVA